MIRRLLSSLLPARPVDAEAFTAEMLARFQAHVPDSKVERVAELELQIKAKDGSAHSVNLHNLFHNCANHPENREVEMTRFVQSLAAIDEGPDVLPKNVVPVVRTEAVIAEWKQSMGGKMKDFSLATEPIGADLVLIYVADSPETVRYLTADDVAGIHLSGQTLRELALDNLSRILTQIKSEGAHGFYNFTAGDCYEPSLILLERIWTRLRREVQGEIVFAVPARGVLMVADSAVPKAVAHLQKAAREIFSQEPYGISDKLYVRHPDRIAYHNPDQPSLSS